MNENRKIFSLGMMTGTSMDGIDVALIKTDGQNDIELLESYFHSFSALERSIIAKAQSKEDKQDPAVIEAEEQITTGHIKAVEKYFEQYPQREDGIEVIGFHGQTIFHAPERGISLQIGNAQKLADETGIPVVYDFRTADIRSGGQGAPLAPVYHAALVSSIKDKPVAVLNLGGIANITYIDEFGHVQAAFDTGPANALMDDWMLENKNEPFDKDGMFAKSGKANEEIVREFLKHPYFQKVPPKSLDRHHFTLEWVSELDGADVMATLATMTIMSVFQAIAHLPKQPKTWLVTGGGRKNKMIIDGLRSLVEGSIVDVDDLNWRGDMLEAEAFAYMAVRYLRNLPTSFPQTTGCKKPTVGGAHVVPSALANEKIVLG